MCFGRLAFRYNARPIYIIIFISLRPLSHSSFHPAPVNFEAGGGESAGGSCGESQQDTSFRGVQEVRIEEVRIEDIRVWQKTVAVGALAATCEGTAAFQRAR